ncbi:MarR family transcriptional regulator [Hydrogenophaga crassostreae]|uniref:MarR family transcriptional regulator n=1 Tax=Hydrogenophaga crassostreae TaxID=1763535 RepID=A0A162T359_9BURK|nr:MarR family winged helix-turn-helix transcriptional regulator [Hydrogenophaga crassostreae]AOW14155.1 MarR family transcriptional regulator [Hydrogenophaga crassostreae]OAD42916.1 MarR family transcriptional regulator [Hydrogenophaga crassostreae]
MSAPKSTRAPSKPKAPRSGAVATPAPVATAEPPLNTSYLESLLGYNARRAALAVISVFLKRMAPFGLKPVEFSVLTLIAHNPGITSRQTCSALDILPPNLVGIIKSLDQRGLIVRKAHPTDGRAQGLHLSAHGRRLQHEAQLTATALEHDAAHALTPGELDKLKALLRKVYQN